MEILEGPRPIPVQSAGRTRLLRKAFLLLALVSIVIASARIPLAGQALYNGIVLPQPWPPSQSVTQEYRIPTYLTNPPAVIPIDVGRQLFVDDFLIQQSTMTRTQHRPVMYPLNPIMVPGPLDFGLMAMPFSGGAWFDPDDQLYKMWLFCGTDPAKVCYAYSSDGKNWIRPSIPDAFIPNTDQVLQNGMVVWMDLEDPDHNRKFKIFTWNTQTTGVSFSPDGIHWTATNLKWPLVYDRTTLFWNPFRKVWVDSMKNYRVLPPTPQRAAYLARSRNYTESADLVTWTPAQPASFPTSYWTGPDVNDPSYYPGGTLPHLYNLDAVGYESVMVGLFSWFHPGFEDDNPNNLPGPDIVEVGVGFSRDGFQWVRPTRGSGPGPNGAFLPASNIPGTWDMGNTQSAGGGFLVVGDELWFYFSGRDGRHDAPWPTVKGSTGLATLRRDGFYSMDAGTSPAVLTTRPVKFSGKHLFVNVKDPAGSLLVELIDPTTGAALATSFPVTADKTLQPVLWNGISDLLGYANQPVQFRFTLANGELYSFWVSPSESGASNGYVAAGGPGFTGPADNLGIAAYPAVTGTPEVYPPGGIVSSATDIKLLTRTAGAAIYYTLDGSVPTPSSLLYTGPFHIAGATTLKAIAVAPGLGASPVLSAAFTVDNTPPVVSLASPTNGQTVSAAITLSANASSNAGIATVEFRIDGVFVGILREAPYTLPLQTTTLTNAVHQITAVATNKLGIQATSNVISVTVQNVFNGPTAGLTGYWSFDSAYLNDPTQFDQSGNNRNATLSSIISVQGVAGHGLLFNGFSTYAQVTSSSLYELTGDLSLSLWVETTNSSRTEALISKYAAGGSGSGYLLRTTPAGTAEVLFGAANVASGPSIATDTTPINDGGWHHLVAVIKLGTSVTFYVDGTLSSVRPINSTPATSATFFQMGLSPWQPFGAYLTGAMDEVRVYNRVLAAAEVAELFSAVGPNPNPTATATFVKTDTATQGNWKGAYGQSGYVIAGDSSSLPPYATVNFSGAALYTWASSTTDPRALLKGASTTDRIASAYYANPTFVVDVNLTDGQLHPVALYALDWSLQQRSETFFVLDAATGALLDIRSASSFANGLYAVWNVTGHVLIYVSGSSGPNAVVNGVFIGPPPGPDMTITKTHNGNFAIGDTAAQYIIAVSNSGAAETIGVVSVTDTLPPGLSAVQIGGPGWNCAQPSGPCTRNDGLAGGTSYPPIALTVGVAANAPFLVTNTAIVSGGGEVETSNNTATDPTVIAAQSNASVFVTGRAQTGVPLRNNFTGWVGTKLTVGSKALGVVALGRLCIAGNSGAHTVKFVNASAGTDVPGGAASLNLAGCAAGQFAYANLSSPITLLANTAYYLVTQEFLGGDQWYDFGPISSTADAAVNSSVYSFNGAQWFTIGAPNSSYVPPNFQYLVLQPTPISVTLQTNLPDLSFSVDGTPYTNLQEFTWTAGSSHDIAVTSPQNGVGAQSGSGTRYAWSSWSDGGGISHTVSPASPATFTAHFITQHQLTAGVSPPGAGSVFLSPPSASGYYASGTEVQLTAVPNTGCNFTGWDPGNPGAVTMSAPRAVTATFQCSGPTTTNFVSGYGLSNPVLRNNFSGWVGMRITVGANPLIVSALGRLFVTGNSGTHRVKLVRAVDGSDVSGGSVPVSMASGAAGQFKYGSLPAPVTLQAYASYYVVSEEFLGGDRWYDLGSISVSNAATVNSSVYSNGGSWVPWSNPNTSYGPLDFQYSLAPADPNPPFVTAFNLNNRPLRNNFTGWIGMKFTAGAAGATVHSLGRLHLAGNSGTHTVKLVRASDGTDVPGASISISMVGGSPGQFTYGDLASPVTLSANTAYYLVSQEFSAGDQWYDFGTLSATASIGAVNDAVYSSDGVNWFRIGGANTSYVPPNLK